MMESQQTAAQTPRFGIGRATCGAVVVALLVVSSFSVSNTRASGTATLRVDPVEQAPGGQFVVSVVQNADVETSGAEANVSFDRTLVHVVDIARGSGYTVPRSSWVRRAKRSKT